MATVKEGWISKRGEFVQNWRARWFVLKTDGTFRGYKDKPSDGELPVNVFEVGAAPRCTHASSRARRAD